MKSDCIYVIWQRWEQDNWQKKEILSCLKDRYFFQSNKIDMKSIGFYNYLFYAALTSINILTEKNSKLT